MSKEIQKHIQDFFKIQQLLGSGAYGHVWKVKEKTTHKTYALKKVFDAFQNDVDSQRTYRQITILHQLNHSQIIKLKGVIKAQNDKDLYLVFEHMQTDLHSLVGENLLEIPHITFIIYQVFKALKYLHSAQLLHRDLKPSNVLINSDCEIKLCDFGLVRSLTRQQSSQLVLSQDVATRWYRSPEMLLGSRSYNAATDVWSVGCILAELIIGQPLLMGGSNIEQLQKILELTGMPKKQDVLSLKSPVAQSLISQFRILKRPFKHYFKGCKFQEQSLLINLIKSMLQFNPQKRITVDQILSHELLAEIRCLKQQIMCKKVILPELDDNTRLKVDDYRKQIYKDIQRRYPEYNLKKVQELNQQYRYNRGHNSLLNRTTSIASFTRNKACNSLLRPSRTKPIVQENNNLNNKTLQHQSLHCNTNHNSYFYKMKAGKINQKNQNSLYYSTNPFSDISNKKDKFQGKQSIDVSTVVEKSPFRRYTKQNLEHQHKITQSIQKIEALEKISYQIKQNQQPDSNSKAQTFTSYLLKKSKSPLKQRKLLYDPVSIYSQSPPKGLRQKQKNVYETMNISNENKITKKAFTRKRKDLIFQRESSNKTHLINPHNLTNILIKDDCNE